MKEFSDAFILRVLRETGFPVIIVPESFLESDDIEEDEDNYILSGLKSRAKKIKQHIEVIPVAG
jgi:hypothetical protein